MFSPMHRSWDELVCKVKFETPLGGTNQEERVRLLGVAESGMGV